MARAASGGASVPVSSPASIERTLDRTIERLSAGPQTREARALLIEARRLRSVIGNWRSIPPSADVHDEMLDRVMQLSSAVGAAFPDPTEEKTSIGQRVPAPDSYDVEATEGYAIDFEPRLYSLDTVTNRQAVPLPRAAEAIAPTPAPQPQAPQPPVTVATAPDRAPLSEEEPTQAWSNATLQAPSDLEPIASAPAPWPVEEPPRLPRASVPPPAPLPTRPSTPPPAVAQLLNRPSVPPAAAVVVAQLLNRPSTPPPAPAPAAPDDAPLPPAAPPRIITYEFDAEGDDLSVPRTQIAAHAVTLAEPVNPLLAILTDPYSPRTDAYRTLRRKLATTPTARVLAVTSAQPGEGKTVFALNLALTLRDGARGRVLVIEANLRTPIMAKMLGFTTPECFIAQLSRHAEDPRAPWVVAEPLPKLHVMAIDPLVPHEPLLDQVTFSMGMERLKQAGYEYIIVDSPPVLGSSDCNVISDAVDALILTALPMKSMRRKMRKAVEQLEPAPILGVVVLEV